MKSIFNSHNIFLKALLALALCLVSGSAWGGSNYYAKVRIQVSPPGAGSIYAVSGSDNSALNSDNTEVTAYHKYESGTKNVTIKIGATPKTGYKFDQLTGWNYSSESGAVGTNNEDGTYTILGQSSSTDDERPTDFGSVTATFSAYKYQISLNPNGGTLSDGATATTNYNYNIEGNGDGNISKLPKVVRTGYDFKGWKVTNTDEDSWWKGHTHSDEDNGMSVVGKWGDVTLTAQWTPVNYQIDLNLDGGTFEGGATTPTTYKYNIEGNGDGNISNLPKVEKTGYSFNGWSIAATTQGDKHGWGDTAEENASVKKHWGDVTLTALWEPIPGYVKITVSGLKKSDSAVFTVEYVSTPFDVAFDVALNSSDANGLIIKIPDVSTGKTVKITPKSWPKNYGDLSIGSVSETVYNSNDNKNPVLYNFSLGERTSNIFETSREF